MDYRLMDLTLKRTAVFLAITVAAFSAAALLAKAYTFAGALIISAPVGYFMLFLLSKDVYKILTEGKANFFALKFIFRLACFAILLYLILVRFQLSPIGAVVGLTIPAFIMTAVILVRSFRL